MCAPVIRHAGQHRNPDMKTRHLLARIAAVVTAAAAIGMFLGPARADAATGGTANQDVRSAMAQSPGSRVDGWANRDVDIGAFNLAMAEELGSQLDGYETPDMDLSSDIWEAMALGIGERMDGWANRDLDIGALSSSSDFGIGDRLDGWANRDQDIGA
jgi:hypothetical protein